MYEVAIETFQKKKRRRKVKMDEIEEKNETDFVKLILKDIKNYST